MLNIFHFGLSYVVVLEIDGRPRDNLDSLP